MTNLALLMLSLTFTCGAAGPRCFECRDMPHPQDCVTSTMCSDSQECHVEQFVTSGGLILYNSGCLAKSRCMFSGKRNSEYTYNDEHHNFTRRQSLTDVVTCQECCQGHLCNHHGCGATGLPPSQRGPYCYNCPTMDHPGDCRDLAICDPGHVCMLHEIHTFGTKQYQSQCQRELVCQAFSNVHPVGRRQATQYCFTCCRQDFCNDNCQGIPPIWTSPTTASITNPSPTTTTPTTTITTTSATTPPTTTTTTPATTPATTTPTTTPRTTTTTQKSTSTATTKSPTTTSVSPTTASTQPTTKSTTIPPVTSSIPTVTVPSTTMPTTHPPSHSTSPLHSTTGIPSTITSITATTPTTQANPSTSVGVTTSSLMTTTSTADACEIDGYTFIPLQQFCFKFYFDKKNWHDANETCKLGGGTLAVADTDSKWNFLQFVVQQENKFVNQSIFIGGHQTQSNDVFYWPDGREITNTAWGHGQPDSAPGAGIHPPGTESCLALEGTDGFLWHDLPCTLELPFICSKAVRSVTTVSTQTAYIPSAVTSVVSTHSMSPSTSASHRAATSPTPTSHMSLIGSSTQSTPSTSAAATSPPVTTQSPGDVCRVNGYKYEQSQNFCFKFNFDNKTWHDANDVCKAGGGTLAVVDTDSKWRFLLFLLKIEDKYTYQSIYIGGHQKQGHDEFYWPDGREITNGTWGHGQPDSDPGAGIHPPGTEPCLALEGTDGFLWHDLPCTLALPFLCSKTPPF